MRSRYRPTHLTDPLYINTSTIESLLISKLKLCLSNGTSIALNIFNSS